VYVYVEVWFQCASLYPITTNHSLVDRGDVKYVICAVMLMVYLRGVSRHIVFLGGGERGAGGMSIPYFLKRRATYRPFPDCREKKQKKRSFLSATNRISPPTLLFMSEPECAVCRAIFRQM